MQIIFGTNYTIATKQHFNLLIFHYALSAPPSTLGFEEEEKRKMCVITFFTSMKKICLIESKSETA
jgi:hypothetical protein